MIAVVKLGMQICCYNRYGSEIFQESGQYAI